MRKCNTGVEPDEWNGAETEGLADLSEIAVNPDLPLTERIQEFNRQSNGNPRVHLLLGYTVECVFRSHKALEECVTEYLRKKI